MATGRRLPPKQRFHYFVSRDEIKLQNLVSFRLATRHPARRFVERDEAPPPPRGGGRNGGECFFNAINPIYKIRNRHRIVELNLPWSPNANTELEWNTRIVEKWGRNNCRISPRTYPVISPNKSVFQCGQRVWGEQCKTAASLW